MVALVAIETKHVLGFELLRDHEFDAAIVPDQAGWFPTWKSGDVSGADGLSPRRPEALGQSPSRRWWCTSCLYSSIMSMWMEWHPLAARRAAGVEVGTVVALVDPGIGEPERR